MADDAQTRSPDDRADVIQDHKLQYWMQMRYWMRKWGVSPPRVSEAADAVGPTVRDGTKYLAKPRA